MRHSRAMAATIIIELLLQNLKFYLSRSDVSHHMLQTRFKALLQLWTKTLRMREGGGSLAGGSFMNANHQVPIHRFKTRALILYSNDGWPSSWRTLWRFLKQQIVRMICMLCEYSLSYIHVIHSPVSRMRNLLFSLGWVGFWWLWWHMCQSLLHFLLMT